MKKCEDLGIGLMVRFAEEPAKSFERLRSFGLSHCQLAAPPDDYLYGAKGRKNTRNLLNAIEDFDMCVTSLFISFPDQDWKDWKNGIGLVPPATRAHRIVRACRSADWARELGVTQIASHVGYVPENADDPVYTGFVKAMQGFCLFLETNNQVLAYETGQEPVKVLARLIKDIGVENQRINFDPANLIIYNQEHPRELLKTMCDKVVHVHCKDACRPKKEGELGTEVRLGDGETNFEELFRTLYKNGYRGPLTIEREINASEELNRDISHAVKLLEKLKAEMAGAR